MRFSIIVLLTIMGLAIYGQGNPQKNVCGTVISPRQSETLRNTIWKESSGASGRLGEEAVRKIAITAHLLQRDNGTGGLREKRLRDEIAILNEYYANSNLSFFILKINEIRSSEHFDFVKDNEDALAAEHDIANTINIYFANSVSDGEGGYFCGYAYFPGQADRIFMDNSCATNGNTLIHEIGHYFTLYHTHGKNNANITDELVDGSNCDIAGDELCDTPADPKLGAGNVNAACVYTGSARDTRGNLFNPDPSNIMSYSSKSCRDNLTNDQYERVLLGYETFRTYLHSKSILAALSVSGTETCAGGSLVFTDESINATSAIWEFEGGKLSPPTGKTIEVTYNTPGVYDVQLIVRNDTEKDTLFMEDYITVYPEPTTDDTEIATSFEEVPLNEKILNEGGGVTFEQTAAFSTSGGKSLFINFFDYPQKGEEDYVVLAPVNSTHFKNFELTFDYAYAPYDENFFDGLAIVYRESCSQEWQTVWQKSGADLGTAEPSTSKFLPSSRGDWKTERITLAIPDSVDLLEVAFKGINGYGNNLYLDHVKLAPERFYKIFIEDIVCHGNTDGRIVVVPDDPEASYEFSLNGEDYQSDSVFTGLSAGIYTVYILDEEGTLYTSEVEIASSQPITVSVEANCNDFNEDESSELHETYFNISQTNAAKGPWYLIEEGDTLFFGSNPVVNLPPGSHEISVVDSATGCNALSTFNVIILDEVNIINPEPAPDDEFAILFLDVAYRGPGDSLRFQLSGSTEWHMLSDTISNLPIGHEGSIRVKNFTSALETCELWGYYRNTVPGFISVDKQDASCESGGKMAISNNGAPVYDADNYPFLYGLNGLGFSANHEFQNLSPGIYTVYVYDNYGDLDPGLTYSYRTKEVEILAQELHSVSAEVYCNDDLYEARFTISDSISSDSGWEYVIDDTIFTDQGHVTGLLPGHHIVAVENLSTGCIATAGFEVTAIDSVKVQVINPTQANGLGSVVPVVHFDGNADGLEYIVENERYTSSWIPISDTLSDLPVDEYILTVRNHEYGHYGCEKTRSFSVRQTDPVIVVLDVTHATCNGGFGAVSARVIGGNGGFQYQLGNGPFIEEGVFDKLIAGEYFLTVKDTDSSTMATHFQITEPEPIALDLSISGPACYGDVAYINVNASGGTGSIMHVFDGDTFPGNELGNIPLDDFSSAGVENHVFMAFDENGCFSSLDLNYDVNTTSLAIDGKACYDFGSANVMVTEEDGLIRYVLNGQFTGENELDERYRCPDLALVEIFSEVYLTPSVLSKKVREITVFPNPVVDIFTVAVPEGLESRVETVAILSLSGKELYRTNNLQVQSRLSAGVYLVRIIGDNFETTRRILQR